MQRLLRTITITLLALCLGMSFAHVLELPAKLRYDEQIYVRIQTTLYVAWGPPGVGGFVEPAAVMATLLLAITARGDVVGLRLLLTSFGCMIIAFPVVFFWRVAPANAAFLEAATTGVIPVDWTEWRMKWESGHALRFVLHASAFVLMASQITRENLKKQPGWSVTSQIGEFHNTYEGPES